MKKQLLLNLFMLMFITACGAPDNISIKPETTKNIRTIAIIEAEEAPLRMMNLGSGAAAFGAIGGAAIAAGSKAEQLQIILKHESFDFSKQLVSDLKRSLASSGYKVSVIKANRKDKYKLMEDYSGVNSNGADAIIDVVITNIGYVTEHFMFSPEWRPESRVFIKMITSRDQQVIYQDTMMYGYHNPFMSGVDIDAPKQFQFENEESVFKAGNKIIVAGLKDASAKIAGHVGEALKK